MAMAPKARRTQISMRLDSLLGVDRIPVERVPPLNLKGVEPLLRLLAFA